MTRENLHITDQGLFRKVGEGARLGSMFAFLDGSLFEGSGPLAWLRSLTQEKSPRVLSLLAAGPTELPGATHELVDCGLDLGVVVSDKELYREGQDTVRLALMDPLRPSTSRGFVLELDGAEFTRCQVRFNQHGLACQQFQNLPCGSYQVRLDGVEESCCQFTVAEYRLAPLVASMPERQQQDGELHFTLRVETFGQPLEGEVRLELSDRGRRMASHQVTCCEGLVQSKFRLAGDGPFAVNVQSVEHPSRTATVPISGSRAAERSETLFSALGMEVSGSLLPSANSHCCARGIHLEEKAVRNTPFVLDRVDGDKARLQVRATASAVTVVVIDPSVPVRARALEYDGTCEGFKRALHLFKDGEFAAARKLFEESRPARRAHPNYAYNVACCYARMRQRDPALGWLRQAVADGYNRWEEMSRDPDLAGLKGDPVFELLCQGGRRHLSFPYLEAGQQLDLEIPSPLAIVAIGAFIGGEPWEGWAAMVPPSQLQPQLKVPAKAEPGSALEVEVSCGGKAGVYLVVKDTRLQTTDSPASRMAARLKGCVDRAHQQLKTGTPSTTFAALAPPPPRRQQYLNSRSLERPTLGAGRRRSGATALNDVVYCMAAAKVKSASSDLFGAVEVCEAPTAGGPMAEDLFCLELDAESAAGGLERSPSGAPSGEAARATREEPEVLYAGILETREGKVLLRVDLPDNQGDYLVEALVLSGGDWTPLSTRCRVAADPYVVLEVPRFVHSRDKIWGRVLTNGNAVELTLDGAPVACDQDHRFQVLPGVYRATATSADGLRRRSAVRRVDEPGKLKRVVNSLQLLEPSDELSRQQDESIRSLRVLPGLKKPFEVMVGATAGYHHLCCEQTAAKMLSASLMALKGDPEGESIFVAGAKRMRTMWLGNGGFSMYPERGGLDTYWGPKAVMYLLSMAPLKEREELSASFKAALDDCLLMARRGCQAYHIHWPPQRFEACDGAYWAYREKGDEAALRFVLDAVAQLDRQQMGQVAYRMQAGYAAATLLRAKVETSLALDLVNQIVADLDENGRLYSTADSVAAIVLMGELKAAGIVGEQGQVELDGRLLSTLEAAEVESCSEVKCKQGLCLVEVSRIVEEDWEAYASNVPLRVSLERADGGCVFRAGDALELKVELEQGYTTGDLVWVCLPDALTRVFGGGQVKRFSVDFEGQDRLSIPLVATAPTDGEQHYCVCVRNMFEQERVGNPGLLRLRVSD